MKNYPSINFVGTNKKYSASLSIGSEFNIFNEDKEWQDHAVVTKLSDTNIWFEVYNDSNEGRISRKNFDEMKTAQITQKQKSFVLKENLQKHFDYVVKTAKENLESSYNKINEFKTLISESKSPFNVGYELKWRAEGIEITSEKIRLEDEYLEILKADKQISEIIEEMTKMKNSFLNKIIHLSIDNESGVIEMKSIQEFLRSSSIIRSIDYLSDAQREIQLLGK